MDEEYPVKKPKLLRAENTQESKMTSFVAPFNFSDTERESMENLLKRQRISDEEGHQLLIAATEYEIALCRDNAARHRPEQPQPQPQPTPQQPLPEPGNSGEQPIATAALALATLLGQAPRELRQQITDHLSRSDPLGRDYGERFLSSLSNELERISAACSGPEPAEAVTTNPTEALPEYMQKFVLQMAEVYSECLESEPSAEDSGPFYQYMELVTDYGELPFTRDSIELQRLLRERGQ